MRDQPIPPTTNISFNFSSEAGLWPTFVHFHPTTPFISPLSFFYELIASLSLSPGWPSPAPAQGRYSRGPLVMDGLPAGPAGLLEWLGPLYGVIQQPIYWGDELQTSPIIYEGRPAEGGQRSLNPGRPDTLIRAGRTSQFMREQKSNGR